eukprot:CAMPEP_0119140958 /NCGR_PEP_ID=MMETSP1310-20130426/30104_1 /TAXON_ID=464262 /ORGANISM="Genus nov. species nov., Strain RCC2339" /LENGTH=653 /DNA_ID=CAMNT_0007132365 /DNA_START=190 /DNA_END=2148 /DNA_ORIENTATION=+
MSPAVRRLMQDLKEMQANPLDNMSANPVGDDMLCWHCNIRGAAGTPYAGGIFHLELKFSSDYPQKAPSAIILGPACGIPHPHTRPQPSGIHLCLDLLGDYQTYFDDIDTEQNGASSHFEGTATGWTAAYTVQKILVQIQQFLGHSFEEIADESLHMYLDRIPGALRSSLEFTCKTCEHRKGAPWPPLPSRNRQPSFRSRKELDVIGDDLHCFHSKRSYMDDCIGMAVNVDYYSNGELKTIDWVLDFISHTAFNEGVRTNTFNGPFTHWIPLYINKDHGEKYSQLAEECLSEICVGKTTVFDTAYVTAVLPTLMNTIVFQLSSGMKHHSSRLLQGYCYVHRLFLHFVAKYPALKETYNVAVRNFASLEKHRIKKCTPNLGRFLVYLTVTDLTWNDVSSAYVYENFDRSVRWMLRSYPWLESNSSRVTRVRNQVTFVATRTSTNLLMFQVYFLKNIARPVGVSLETIANQYDERLGQPEARMAANLQNACRTIKNVSSWNEFFAWIDLAPPSASSLTRQLWNAVLRSAAKHYHEKKRNPKSIKLPRDAFFQELERQPFELERLAIQHKCIVQQKRGMGPGSSPSSSKFGRRNSRHARSGSKSRLVASDTRALTDSDRGEQRRNGGRKEGGASRVHHSSTAPELSHPQPAPQSPGE